MGPVQVTGCSGAGKTSVAVALAGRFSQVVLLEIG